ncbi:hypothetical protein V1514DRAFT_303077 [Lipomyces japonicus]|uniref:uncharacterized protein n=1 Tax=Lipomyces japonicus TaxID=56871 RepID=UPI0034CE5E9D
MRKAIVCLIFSLLIATTFAAWTEKDHEIFRLHEEIEQNEGKGVNFYHFLGLSTGSSSTADQITKAYRKKSRQLHPDKNPSAKATERFARLGVVANILRGSDKERYDFFLEKGFPKWKGTGYYYARFRPGLITVVIFLYAITSVAHYVVLKITAQSEIRRMRQHISDCKLQAWPSGLPPAHFSKRRLQDQSGRTFVVYPDGTVWIVDPVSNDEFLLDVNAIEPARWGNTVLVRLPKWVWTQALARLGVEFPTRAIYQDDDDDDDNDKQQSDEDGNEFKKKIKSGSKKSVAAGQVVAEAVKVAGGRRRRRK